MTLEEDCSLMLPDIVDGGTEETNAHVILLLVPRTHGTDADKDAHSKERRINHERITFSSCQKKKKIRLGRIGPAIQLNALLHSRPCSSA